MSNHAYRNVIYIRCMSLSWKWRKYFVGIYIVWNLINQLHSWNIYTCAWHNSCFQCFIVDAILLVHGFISYLFDGTELALFWNFIALMFNFQWRQFCCQSELRQLEAWILWDRQCLPTSCFNRLYNYICTTSSTFNCNYYVVSLKLKHVRKTESQTAYFAASAVCNLVGHIFQNPCLPIYEMLEMKTHRLYI